MEQWNIEQQEAETIDQACQQCQGLLWRCYNELLYHLEEECPTEHGVLALLAMSGTPPLSARV